MVFPSLVHTGVAPEVSNSKTRISPRSGSVPDSSPSALGALAAIIVPSLLILTDEPKSSPRVSP